MLCDKLKRLTRQLPEFNDRIEDVEETLNILLSEIGNSNVQVTAAQDGSLSNHTSVDTSSYKISPFMSDNASLVQQYQPDPNVQRERRSKKAADVSSNSFSKSKSSKNSKNSKNSKSSKSSSSSSSSSSFTSKKSPVRSKISRNNEKPKYVGQGIRQSNNRIFYEALVIKGDQYIRPGDSVILQSGGGDELPFVCRVEEMWCDITKEEAHIRGKWFYRESDIVNKSKMDNQILQGKLKDTDIFLSDENQNNSAETVLGKILVVYNDDSGKEKELLDSIYM